MSKMLILKQMQKKIDATDEVDEVIKAVCQKIKENDLIPEKYAETVKALASLVLARALLK